MKREKKRETMRIVEGGCRTEGDEGGIGGGDREDRGDGKMQGREMTAETRPDFHATVADMHGMRRSLYTCTEVSSGR